MRPALLLLTVFLQCSFTAKTDFLPELALLAMRRPLVSSSFTHSGTDLTWTSGLCGVMDQSTGVGPYTFPVDSYVDNVLITVTSNIIITNPICDVANDSEFSLYVDGVKRQTLYYDRCWGQTAPMTGAFVIPLGLGIHTMELKFCANSTAVPTRIPQIRGAYPTVLTATSLASSPNYLSHASFVLPTGTTALADTSGLQVPVVSGGNSMSVTVTPPESALLWHHLSLGGMSYQIGAYMNYSLSSATSEFWQIDDDGPAPGTLSTTTLAPAGSSTVTALHQSNGTSTIVGRASHDNSLNLVAFKAPATGTYGKAITGTVTETLGVITSLLNVPISLSAPARYLISFSGNNISSPGAGHGCDFFLYVNGSLRVRIPYTSSNSFQRLGASILSVETVPAGTNVPVEIRFMKNAASNCVVDQATLEVVPLE